MTTLARYCFSNLALSAKVHRYLDTVSEAAGRRDASAADAFDAAIERAVPSIRGPAPRRQQADARAETLRRLEADLDEVAHALKSCRPSLPDESAERFAALIAVMRRKIREKGSTGPSP